MRGFPLRMSVTVLAVMGLVSTDLAAQTAIWHRDGGVGQWDLSKYPSHWPAPFWGPEADPPRPAEHLTVEVDYVYPALYGYTWIETTWVDEQSVPASAPTIDMTSEEGAQITVLPGYPYRNAEHSSWTYAWELAPHPSRQTLKFPNADYFQLDNGLLSVKLDLAHGIETGYWSRRDTSIAVWNRSDLAANDFHVSLDPFPESFRVTENGGYSSVAVEATGAGYEFTWQDGTTESGTVATFGLYSWERLRDHAPIGSTVQWTQDGSVIATLPDVWPDYWMLSAYDTRSDITNRSQAGETVWIQRRVFDWDYWYDWILLDPEPVELPAGESLFYDFSDACDVKVEYDVFEDDDGTPGQLLVTFTDTVELIPEPGTLALLFLGGLTMGGLATIRRRSRSTRRKRRLRRQLGKVV